ELTLGHLSVPFKNVAGRPAITSRRYACAFWNTSGRKSNSLLFRLTTSLRSEPMDEARVAAGEKEAYPLVGRSVKGVAVHLDLHTRHRTRLRPLPEQPVAPPV